MKTAWAQQRYESRYVFSPLCHAGNPPMHSTDGHCATFMAYLLPDRFGGEGGRYYETDLIKRDRDQWRNAERNHQIKNTTGFRFASFETFQTERNRLVQEHQADPVVTGFTPTRNQGSFNGTWRFRKLAFQQAGDQCVPEACFLIQQFTLMRQMESGDHRGMFKCPRVQLFKFVGGAFEPDDAGDFSLEPDGAAKPEARLLSRQVDQQGL